MLDASDFQRFLLGARVHPANDFQVVAPRVAAFFRHNEAEDGLFLFSDAAEFDRKHRSGGGFIVSASDSDGSVRKTAVNVKADPRGVGAEQGENCQGCD